MMLNEAVEPSAPGFMSTSRTSELPVVPGEGVEAGRCPAHQQQQQQR